MKVLIVEPEKAPKVREIGDGLESMQSIVNGNIQAVYPFADCVALICNEEGKLLGLPLNRALRDDKGKIYDIISGTFFLCAAPSDSDEFSSLDEEQISKYKRLFEKPELFIRIKGNILAVPM